MCQSSSIAFLSQFGFDFNKLFKQGIGYMAPDQVVEFKKRLETNSNKSDNVPVGINKGFVDAQVAKVQDWFDHEPTELTFSLAPCNSFLRLLLHHAFEETF